jgi:hypothetical protein
MRRTSPPRYVVFTGSSLLFSRHDRKAVIFILMSIFLDSYEHSGLTCLTGRPGDEPRSQASVRGFCGGDHTLSQ